MRTNLFEDIFVASRLHTRHWAGPWDGTDKDTVPCPCGDHRQQGPVQKVVQKKSTGEPEGWEGLAALPPQATLHPQQLQQALKEEQQTAEVKTVTL